MDKYTLLRINENWYRARVFTSGRISTTEAFDSMAHAICFTRNSRKLGYCKADTMRYW